MSRNVDRAHAEHRRSFEPPDDEPREGDDLWCPWCEWHGHHSEVTRQDRGHTYGTCPDCGEPLKECEPDEDDGRYDDD